MKRVLDTIRAVLISPEMLCLLIPIGIWLFWPGPAEFAATQVSEDLKWGLGGVLVPVGLSATCYTLGTDVLSPHGTRRVILEWPDYWMLKSRVVLALVFCVMAIVIVVVGLYWIAAKQSSLGAALILSGWLSSAAALATVSLARWRIRELLGE